MTIIKYKTFEAARKSQWNFHPEQEYYRNLRGLFEFYSRISQYQKHPMGVFRYDSLEEATAHDLAWKVMMPSSVYQQSEKKINKLKNQAVFKKSRNFSEAEEWDIQQHLDMTPYERQEISRILKERVYGKDGPDIREGNKQ